MKIVAVSQRVDLHLDRNERRDALDQRLSQWLVAAGCVPVPVPNSLCISASYPKGLSAVQDWLQAINPDAVLLSGGNDIGEAPERDATERGMLIYARDRFLPLLGICRGMQMMAVWAGGSLMPLTGHVASRHTLEVEDGFGPFPDEVNSFHNFVLADCPFGFVVTARTGDGAIEAIRHESLPWEGWMWHPERESCSSSVEIYRLGELLIRG